MLQEIFAKKLDFFQRLRKDCDRLTGLQGDGVDGNPPDNPDGEAPLDRIAFAEHQMKESREQCQRLGADLREGLNSVSQCHKLRLLCPPLPVLLPHGIHNPFLLRPP